MTNEVRLELIKSARYVLMTLIAALDEFQAYDSWRVLGSGGGAPRGRRLVPAARSRRNSLSI